MTAKKKTKRKTAKKKSGVTKKKAVKKTKSSVTKKKVAKKTKKKKVAARGSAGEKTSASIPRARKKRKKRPGKRPTKAERKAGHSTRRKPFTGGVEARKEILSFFGSDDLSELTSKELAERQLAFLRAYANRGIVRDGCIAADMSRGAYMRQRETYEEFNVACKAAEEMAADRLEAEAHRRAFDGFEKPVIYQGEITDTYKEYSDSLMGMLMKGYKKDKYKERSEHSTPPGQPMQLEAETKESVVSSLLGMIVNKPDPTN